MTFQILGAIAMAIFYGVYVWKMISQRIQGIRTDQLGHNKSGKIKYIELGVKFASYLALIISIFSPVFNASMLPPVVRSIGCCIAFIGVAFFCVSVFTMKDSWRAGISETEDTSLVAEGIYQISRNPAFVGFDMLYIGTLLMFFNWPLLIVLLGTIFMFHLQIVEVEEPFLLATFGDSYKSYMRKVHRYIGLIRD